MPITFIHAADLHLDHPFQGLHHLPSAIKNRVRVSTFTALDQLIDSAIQNKVDFIVLAGDIFDEANRSLRAQMRLKMAFERLAEVGIHVYMLYGNHDHLDGEWHDLKFGENVHIFSDEPHVMTFEIPGQSKVNLYGFSYGSRHISENKIPLYTKNEDADYHIGLLHGSVQGNTDHDVYAPFSIQELLDKDFDYWGLGHIHQRLTLRKTPPIQYSGSIQGLSPKEVGDKGFYLVNIEENRADTQFIAAADVIWEKVEINMDKFSDMAAFISEVEDIKERVRRDNQGVLLKLILKNTSPLYGALGENGQMEDFLEAVRETEEVKSNFVWIVSIDNQMKRAYDREQLRKESHFLGDLIRLSENVKGLSSVKELYHHSQGKRFLTPLTEADQRQIVEEAEKLLIDSLHTGIKGDS